MRIVLLLSTLFLFAANASVYYAKLEPYDTFAIKAAASGEVVLSYKEAEGRVSKGGVLLQLDDALNKKELASSQKKLKSLQNTLRLTLKNIENAKKIEQIQASNYNKIKDLKTKPQVEKDNQLISYIGAQNSVLSLENSKENLEVSISDLEYKIAVLKDTIENKTVKIDNGHLIYKVYVNVGDYVNVGTLLVDAYDISKGKLTVFLSREDVQKAQNGVVYIDDKATNLKVDKIWSVVDTQNISSYRAEIIVPAPKRFSQLMKIEFKEQ